MIKNKVLLARKRRTKRVRRNIRELGKKSLIVTRKNKHIYAQVVSEDGTKVLAAASSLGKDFVNSGLSGSGVEGAKRVGTLVAEKALASGVTAVAFDKSGRKYHGRIKALADAARAAGMLF